MIVDKAILNNNNEEADHMESEYMKKMMHLTPQNKLHSLMAKGVWNDSNVVLQLGGNDPKLMVKASLIAAAFGYKEININCGCPSDKVAGSGMFGAAMMFDPKLVAEAALAMREEVKVEITVKCRIGVDGVDSFGDLVNFIDVVSSRGGVKKFQIHARKALLRGLSPEQNRSVPPLRYEWVYGLAQRFPELQFYLNGGVDSLQTTKAMLEHPGYVGSDNALSGVMIGRAAYGMPWEILAAADKYLYDSETNPCKSRRQVVEEYVKYCTMQENLEDEDGAGWRRRPTARALIKPLYNLFAGERGGKNWRRRLDEGLKDFKHSGSKENHLRVEDMILMSLRAIPEDVLDAPPPDIMSLSDANSKSFHLGPKPTEDSLARGCEASTTWLFQSGRPTAKL